MAIPFAHARTGTTPESVVAWLARPMPRDEPYTIVGRRGDTAVIFVHSDLTFDALDCMQRSVEQALELEPARLAIDASSSELIDAAAISFLEELASDCREAGVAVRLTLSPAVRAQLERIGDTGVATPTPVR